MSRNKFRFALIRRTQANVSKSFNPRISSSPEQEIDVASTDSRFARLFDHGSWQTLIGIVGGIVGTFLDGRYFALLGLWASWSLYRSNALVGIKLGNKVLIHVTAVSALGCVLFYMGTRLNVSRPHIFTPNEYKDALLQGTKTPIQQQVTNIVNNYKTENAAQTFEPRVDMSEWRFSGGDSSGRNYVTDSVDNGIVPAIDAVSTVNSASGLMSKEGEDYLFREIDEKLSDNLAPKNDMSPGYKRMIVLHAPFLSASELDRWGASNIVTYLGAKVSYKDTRGNHYVSELCMYFSEVGDKHFRYCDGHNLTRKVKTAKAGK